MKSVCPCLNLILYGDFMGEINQVQFPDFIDISNYSPLHKVFVKQLERQEQILTDIRDLLIEHNNLHAKKPKAMKKSRG